MFPLSSILFVPKKVGDRVCECMHARAIYNVLTHGLTVQKGGSNGLKPPNSRKSHPASSVRIVQKEVEGSKFCFRWGLRDEVGVEIFFEKGLKKRWGSNFIINYRRKK